jgi:hypothetical protein
VARTAHDVFDLAKEQRFDTIVSGFYSTIGAALHNVARSVDCCAAVLRLLPTSPTVPNRMRRVFVYRAVCTPRTTFVLFV